LQNDSQLELAYKQVAICLEPVQLNPEIMFKLHSLGLIKIIRNDCIPSCDLYRQYFSSDPPHAHRIAPNLLCHVNLTYFLNLMQFIVLTGVVIYILLGLFLSDYQTSLTCRRPQNFCQLSNKRIIGLKTEKFPLKSLISAEAVGDADRVPGVILKTSQGEKMMVSTFLGEADEAAIAVNTFISNPQQELLQVKRSNFITALWVLIQAIAAVFILLQFFKRT
jgi:hypothetical protein